MTTVYQFFLYFPIYINSRVGYLDLEANLKRAADRWDFEYRLAVANGDGYGDPRELGVLKVDRETQEQAEAVITGIINALPVPNWELTPAEALDYVKLWGAPNAYFQDGEIIKP